MLLVDHEELAQFFAFRETLILAAFTTSLLALDDGVNEARHHVEFCPVNLAGVVIMIVRIAFMCTNEIGEVNFPVRSVLMTPNSEWGGYSQCGYTHALRVPQGHSVLLVRSYRLKKLVPLLEALPVIG